MLMAQAQQDWNRLPGGDVINSTEYLGARLGSSVPLVLKTVPALPIDFYTTDIFRARINPRVQYPLLNTFPNIPADGFTLITPDNGFLGQAPRGPFSRLHLAEGGQTGNAEQFGYRPWQKNGITFTGNDDQGYLGQKYRDGESGFTDMVMQWSDNPGAVRADRLRFLFTSAYTGATSGMNSREGLEGMRLWPTWENRINVGIGDFYAGNLIDPVNIIDPTERLDVLDGRVRIRKLPDDPQATTPYKVMVVDATAAPSAERGVVKWVDPSVFIDPDCDWTVENNGVSGPLIGHDVYTATGSSDDCPDATDAIGVGISQPVNKLDVKHSDMDVQRDGGLRVDVETNHEGWRSGISTTIQPATGGAVLAFGTGVNSTINNVGLGQAGIADSYGVLARSNTDQNIFLRKSIGVFGDAVASAGTPTSLWGGEFIARGTGATVTEGIGVYAHTTNNSGAMGTSYGIWAEAAGATNNFAGWFQGTVFINGVAGCTAMAWTSDSSLKTNVEDVSNASELLDQVRPRTYEFLSAEHPTLNLPEGPQLGVIAQELEAVLPQLVTEVNIGAARDEEGQLIEESSPVKAVNYIGLIPLLVAGFQEQQERISILESELASCCASGGVRAVQNTGMAAALETDLRIIPNPWPTAPSCDTPWVPKERYALSSPGPMAARCWCVMRECVPPEPTATAGTPRHWRQAPTTARST